VKPARHETSSYEVVLHPGTQRTWVTVIKRRFRADDVILDRLGHVSLELPRRALDDLTDAQAVTLLVLELGRQLAPYVGGVAAPAPPPGDMGGRGWSQPTLDLDLRP
jgi:hypothetical protein